MKNLNFQKIQLAVVVPLVIAVIVVVSVAASASLAVGEADILVAEIEADNNPLTEKGLNAAVGIREDEKKEDIVIMNFYDFFGIDIDEIIESSYRNWRVYDDLYDIDCSNWPNTEGEHIHNERCGHDPKEWELRFGWDWEHDGHLFVSIESELDRIINRSVSISEERFNDIMEFYTDPLKYLNDIGASIEEVKINVDNHKKDSVIAYCINKCKNDSYRLSDSCAISCVRLRSGNGCDVDGTW